MNYGVRRLVVINSGKYSYANIDLSKPVHLVAPNNSGKTTLVNCLQFLFIDEVSKMQFGRSLEDTSKHYFGADLSYLIFECLTPSGIQCMLVHGLGNLQGGKFERFVYDKEFRDSDYLTASGEICGFDVVKTNLADRHLSKVKTSELWQVLSGNAPSGNGEMFPRFNILPIKRKEEYHAFRDVFVHLLSLKDANERELKRLIVEAYSRHVGERKIDVALQYKQDFERLEASERTVHFIRSVANDIDQGKDLRRNHKLLTDKLTQTAPIVWNDARRCNGFIGFEHVQLEGDLAKLEPHKTALESERDESLKKLARLETELEALQKQWDTLVLK